MVGLAVVDREALWRRTGITGIIKHKYIVASLASATAGMALLAPLASHRTATQCLFIIEVIKLSG